MTPRIMSCLMASILATPTLSEELQIGEQQQTELNVTIYNSNLALIKDTRKVTLPAGTQQLAFRDVSAHIKPETSILRGKGIELLEQNFEYDLLSPESLLNKFIGKTVSLEHSQSDGTIRSEKAKVLANNNGTVLLVGDKIRTTHASDAFVFEDVPKDLRDKPTLSLLIDNQTAGEKQLSLSYLSNHLNWKSDYVVSLNDGKTLDLKGWVTLDNQTGTTYKNAKLQLVAGELNRVQSPELLMNVSYDGMQKRAAPQAQTAMKEESLFEYHLYSLTRPTTIKNKQQKQVSLIKAADIPYEKQLFIDGNYSWQPWNYSSGGSKSWNRSSDITYRTLNTEVRLQIDNTKAKNLGIALPAGIIRTYQKDSQGNMQFIGEDRIDHTPENERINIVLGKSFDVTAKSLQTDFSSKTLRANNAPDEDRQTQVNVSYEVVFKNAKKTAVNVHYLEHFLGQWKITQQSIASNKLSSRSNLWQIKIPAKGKTTLKYSAEMRI